MTGWPTENGGCKVKMDEARQLTMEMSSRMKRNTAAWFCLCCTAETKRTEYIHKIYSTWATKEDMVIIHTVYYISKTKHTITHTQIISYS